MNGSEMENRGGRRVALPDKPTGVRKRASLGPKTTAPAKKTRGLVGYRGAKAKSASKLRSLTTDADVDSDTAMSRSASVSFSVSNSAPATATTSPDATAVSSSDSDNDDPSTRIVGLKHFKVPDGDGTESSSNSDSSLLEDAIQSLPEADFGNDDPEVFSPAEAFKLRQLLRAVGPSEFCLQTVDSGRFTPKKLLTAFGIRAPSFLDDMDDETKNDAYLKLLTHAFTRELNKRAKLVHYNTLDDAVNLLRTRRNIMVITGAGISTSLGIPDFRSKGTGLYSKLERMGLNVADPQEVFDIEIFREDPTIFYTVAKEIIVKIDRHTPTHAFIGLLDRMGKLLTNYTQNIDNVEASAGISADRLIQCHGSFATATCLKCGYKCPGEDIFPDIRAKRIPRCPECTKSHQKQQKASRAAATANKRKRGGGALSASASNSSLAANRKRRRNKNDFDDDETDDDNSGKELAFDHPHGIMKPDITFFGEDLPSEFGRRLAHHDRDKVDLVVVIGTSLKVTPVSEIISWLPPDIPQMCISLEPIAHMNFDIDLLGECDTVVAEICRRAGWPLDHDMVPRDQVVDISTQPGFAHRHSFKQVHPAKEVGPKKEIKRES